MSAALTMLRQPRFSCVEALGLGKSAKLGKTGAASLAKVCPHLRELVARQTSRRWRCRATIAPRSMPLFRSSRGSPFTCVDWAQSRASQLRGGNAPPLSKLVVM